MPTIAEIYALALQNHQSGNLYVAEQLYRQVLQADPNHADSLHLLGVLAFQTGHTDTSVRLIRQALAVNPRAAPYHSNLGLALEAIGQVDNAISCYEEALRLEPNYPEAHSNLGNAFWSQGKLDSAVTHFRHALRLRPPYAEAHYNLGNALRDMGRFEEATEAYREALRLRPDIAAVHNNLGEVLLRQGWLDQAMASFHQALRIQPGLEAAERNLLFCSNHDPRANVDTVFAEHRRWGQRQQQGKPRVPHTNTPEPDRRLRIGYVSPDFRRHPLTLYMEPVLTNHDPHQVEVFCYSEVSNPDAVTARLQRLAHNWRSTSRQTDAQVAEQIRQDRIDILLDLAGHTWNSRLPVFAYMPAPVQATWLGYLNTTGLTTVDYRFTDDILDPPDQPVRDTEQLLRLPGGMCCFAPPDDAPAVAAPPALQRSRLTFGSLNNLFKLNDFVFDLWSRVLQSVPGSTILLYRDTLTSKAQHNIRQQFLRRGIAEERLDLRQAPDSLDFLKVYAEIDVGLDVFPWSGGVTTCEALWMGVPVLTLAGLRPASRNSAALLSRVGLTDWVAHTPDEYVALAERLAGNLDGLARLRCELRDRMLASLCDARRFTRVLESAYRTVWQRWCVQQS